MMFSPKKHVLEILAEHRKMVDRLESESLEILAEMANALIDCIKAGGTVYICGNGGSAADAQHISGELIGRFQRERRAIAALALTTDSSVMTSVANDYDYENIFARQVEGLVRKGDILWALSTSGNSVNVLKAAEVAIAKGAKVLAFTGRLSSRLEEMSDICFCAESEATARSQEVHQIAYHIICDIVERRFVAEGGK